MKVELIIQEGDRPERGLHPEFETAFKHFVGLMWTRFVQKSDYYAENDVMLRGDKSWDSLDGRDPRENLRFAIRARVRDGDPAVGSSAIDLANLCFLYDWCDETRARLGMEDEKW